MCLRLESSTYTLHQTPSLKLYGQVDPSATRVAVLARGITITLGKQRNLLWMQLSRQKFSWIKKDPNAALDNDFDPTVEGLSEPGFTMAGQGKSPRGTKHFFIFVIWVQSYYFQIQSTTSGPMPSSYTLRSCTCPSCR